MLGKLAVILLAVSLQGCAELGQQLSRDPRDTPWDPKGGAQLFEQIPPWDGHALRQCGGHLPPEQARREGRSMRC
jgi:hypothetical protein